MSKPDRVVVIGASGFGRESLDVLEAMISAGSKIEVVGVVDDDPSELNLQRLKERGVAYIGSLDTWIADAPTETQFVLGIGNPSSRSVLVEKLEGLGILPFSAIHPSSVIGSNFSFEEGLVLCAGAVVSTNVRVGRHVHINPNVTIGHDSVLKDFVSVNPGAVVSGEVTLESGVLVGAAATVLQQLTVGERTVVGAAALITKVVPSDVVVIGIPGAW